MKKIILLMLLSGSVYAGQAVEGGCDMETHDWQATVHQPMNITALHHVIISNSTSQTVTIRYTYRLCVEGYKCDEILEAANVSPKSVWQGRHWTMVKNVKFGTPGSYKVTAETTVLDIIPQVVTNTNWINVRNY